MAVDAAEDAVLHRVGVLELVDQREGELRADVRGQRVAAFAAQCAVELQQQVVEAQFGTALLLGGEGAAQLGGGVGGQAGAQVVGLRGAGRGHPGVDGGHRGVLGHRLALLELEAGAAEALDVLRRLRAFAPGGQRGQPGVEDRIVVLAAVAVAVEVRAKLLAPQRLQCGAVTAPEGAGRRFPLIGQRQRLAQRAQFLHHVVRRVERLALQVQPRVVAAQQRLDALPQRLGRGEALQQRARGRRIQRVVVPTPVVVQHALLQVLQVGLQRLREQAAAAHRVLAQHAPGPAVDGVDGGLVHPLRGGAQAVRAGEPLVGRIAVAQRGQHVAGLRRGFAGEHARRFGQPGADALAQLLRGGFGEGHDQDLGRRERPREGAARLAVAQHQAQVEQRDRVGLAGAGAGLDQARAVQREAQRVQRLRAGHASSSAPWRGLPKARHSGA